MIRAVLVVARSHVAETFVVPVVIAVKRQRENVRARGGKLRGAVAVVEVHVEHRGGADFARRDERIERDDQPIEGAETFAVIRARVMKPADHRRRHTIAQSLPRRRQTAAARQAHRRIQLRRPRKLLRLRQRPRLAGPNRREIFRRMHAAQVRLRHRRGRGEPHLRKLAQPFRHEREFADRHDVRPERRGVAGMVEGGQHCVGRSSAMTASSGGSRSSASSGCARSAARNGGAKMA